MSSSWTPLPHSRGMGSHLRDCLQGTIFVLCLFALSACGQSSPEDTSASAANSSTGPGIPAISAPPVSGERPAPLGTTGTPKSADGLPVLQPRGVNASQLFAQKLSEPDDRMNRLETAVQELRNDFDAMAPSIVRLVSVEKDIQELVSQLETLVSGEPSVPPMEASMLEDTAPYDAGTDTPNSVPAPAGEDGADGAPLPLNSEQANAEEATPAEESPQAAASSAPPPAPTQQTEPAKPPAVADAGGAHVTAIRIGEHPGKTRIVLDMDAKASFTADLDNGEKILVVELPNAQWSAADHKSFSSSPLLTAYDVSASNNGKGSILILKLKGPASILYKDTMAADSGTGQKIVIDIGQGNGGNVPTQ